MLWYKLRQNLFATPGHAILTLLSLWLIISFVPGLLDWMLFSAVFTASNGAECRAISVDSACWSFVIAKWKFLVYGQYPPDQYWRVNLVGLLGLIPFIAVIYARRRKALAIYLLTVFPVVAFFLLTGNFPGLTHVPTSSWGGLLITFVVSFTSILASFPLGIALALGRRAELPIIRWSCVAIIELWRGVPIITILFMAALLLPLFLPEGLNFDKLLRCIVGMTIAAAAYMAESIRGGLQAVHRGQYEAAAALGLGYWRTNIYIILPQALRLSIPALNNNAVAFFKDTSLVLIIGIFDLLGVVYNHLSDIQWSAPQVAPTAYVAAGAVFWFFCFVISQLIGRVERSFKYHV